MALLDDYLLFIKLFVFLYFARWAMENLGYNKTLFIIAILVLGYYIFFARWTIIGTLIVLFIVFVLHGIGGFIQDMIFQYDMVAQMEAEEKMIRQNMLPWQRW